MVIKKILWDPTETVATRPLAIQKDGTWFTFGWDITKNVWELFGPAGYIRTTYSYEPFGNVSMNESGVVQPFRFSSEFYDEELDLVYYNYRHYSPALGRFLSRAPIEEFGGLNLYAFVGNNPILNVDSLGMASKLKPCKEYARWILSENFTRYKGLAGRKDVEVNANECGPKDSLITYVIPNGPWPVFLWDVSFEEACNNHDYCYASCDSRGKVDCDVAFRREMEAQCDLTYAQGSFALSRCYWAADKYATAVMWWGTDAYIAAQEESCEWEECAPCSAQ